MGATYTRQSSSTIVDGATIEAAHFNDEFDQLVAALAASTGHSHDGTTAEGGNVTKLLGTAITIGDASAGTDIAVTFDGESNDGVLTWMEDEDYFKFSDDILINSTEKVMFQDTGTYIYSNADGDLDLVSDGTAIDSINIESAGGITLDAGSTTHGITYEDDGTPMLQITNSSSDVVIKPLVDAKDIIFQQYDGTEVARIEDNATFNVSSAGKFAYAGTAVTTTAAELNLIDGGTARGTTSVASGDGILINDAGTMRMTDVDTVSTYFASHSVGGGSIVTTGALDSGSITSGFGAIDNGTSGIRTNTFTAETSVVPSASDGATLGSASLEWSDLYLADSAVVYFGDDQDVTVTHDPDDGLILKSTATSDDNPFLLTIQTGETDIAANDILGAINFQAPDEGASADAILVAAGIEAVSEGDFSSSNNATKLSFKTAASEAAAEKASLSSTGVFTATSFAGSGAGLTAGTTPLTTLDIDGGTDIGEGIVDADLFIIDNGAGGTNRKTAASRLKTYIGSTALTSIGSNLVPDGGGTRDIGTSSAEWNDLYLADTSVVYFGNDQDITLTHVADVGLTLTHVATADNKPIVFQLKSEEDAIIADEVIASIEFAAGDSGGTDGATVAAGIHAIAEGTFADDANATKLVFTTGVSETAASSATAKMTLSSAGNLTVAGDLTVSGDDLAMATNTSGAALIADGTNFNPVVISGDISIATNGVAAIGSGVIVTADIAADAITNAKIADNAIDSEHYTDGSIDTVHLAADAVTGAKIADDAIDSEHYAAGSIDTAHIADDQITLAKMASGTDGNVISYDASGNPVAIATGNDGQVLTSTGAGSPPAFEDAAGGGLMFIGTVVASNSSTITVTGLDATYDHYVIGFSDIVPSEEGDHIELRFGDSGGIDSGGSDYSWGVVEKQTDDTNVEGANDESDDSIFLVRSTGSDSKEGMGGTFTIHSPGDATTNIKGTGSFVQDRNTGWYGVHGFGTRLDNIAITQVQAFTAYNIESGRMTVWGMKHS